MCTRDKAIQIVQEMSRHVRELYPDGEMEVILFGSYARHEETDESDIDVMYLVDAPRSDIVDRNWKLGEAAANVLFDYGVVVSPIVENKEYYLQKAEVLPFFRNIQDEGVILSA